MSVKLGGYQLQKRRKKLDLTLEDIQRITNGKISAVAASRIENGAFARPSYELITEYGKILGMSPNEIAFSYGLWSVKESSEDRLEGDTASTIRSLIKNLPEHEREEILHTVLVLLRDKLDRNQS